MARVWVMGEKAKRLRIWRWGPRGRK